MQHILGAAAACAREMCHLPLCQTLHETIKCHHKRQRATQHAQQAALKLDLLIGADLSGSFHCVGTAIPVRPWGARSTKCTSYICYCGELAYEASSAASCRCHPAGRPVTRPNHKPHHVRCTMSECSPPQRVEVQNSHAPASSHIVPSKPPTFLVACANLLMLSRCVCKAGQLCLQLDGSACPVKPLPALMIHLH